MNFVSNSPVNHVEVVSAVAPVVDTDKDPICESDQNPVQDGSYNKKGGYDQTC